MSLEQGTKLSNGKIIDFSFEESTSTNIVLAESNTNDSDTNDIFDISSQLNEIKEDYEKKISELQSESSQLKDLMMVVIKNAKKIVHHQDPKAFQSKSKKGFDMVTGVSDTHSTRPPSTFTSHIRQYHDEDTDDDGGTSPRSHEERILNAIETIPQRIKSSTTNTKLLQTNVSNFRGQKDKQFAKEDLKEVARYKRDQARYDSTTETFGDFNNSLKKTAKQAFGNEADKVIKMFLFDKLPVEFQQELTKANKEETSPEEVKTYSMRKYHYQQYTTPQTTIQPFNAVTSTNTNTNNKPATTTTQPERKKFEGHCFYCGKTGHRKIECRTEQCDEANGIKKEDAIPMKKQTDLDNSKTTPNWYVRSAGTQGTQHEIVDDGYQKRAAQLT